MFVNVHFQHLRKMSNFNSYLAILSALDSAPIRRLDWQRQNLDVSDAVSSSMSVSCLLYTVMILWLGCTMMFAH